MSAISSIHSSSASCCDLPIVSQSSAISVTNLPPVILGIIVGYCRTSDRETLYRSSDLRDRVAVWYTSNMEASILREEFKVFMSAINIKIEEAFQLNPGHATTALSVYQKGYDRFFVPSKITMLITSTVLVTNDSSNTEYERLAQPELDKEDRIKSFLKFTMKTIVDSVFQIPGDNFGKVNLWQAFLLEFPIICQNLNPQEITNQLDGIYNTENNNRNPPENIIKFGYEVEDYTSGDEDDFIDKGSIIEGYYPRGNFSDNDLTDDDLDN